MGLAVAQTGYRAIVEGYPRKTLILGPIEGFRMFYTGILGAFIEPP